MLHQYLWRVASSDKTNNAVRDFAGISPCVSCQAPAHLTCNTQHTHFKYILYDDYKSYQLRKCWALFNAEIHHTQIWPLMQYYYTREHKKSVSLNTVSQFLWLCLSPFSVIWRMKPYSNLKKCIQLTAHKMINLTALTAWTGTCLARSGCITPDINVPWAEFKQPSSCCKKSSHGYNSLQQANSALQRIKLTDWPSWGWPSYLTHNWSFLRHSSQANNHRKYTIYLH